MFSNAGFKITIRPSTEGSQTPTVIDTKGAPINQIRLATGEGMHKVPYIVVKGNHINVKVVTGPKSQYVGEPSMEKATFYWVGGE